MKLTTTLDELKVAIYPYVFFWKEWTENDNCNLTKAEINIINTFLKDDFKPTLTEKTPVDTQTECIKGIIKKLQIEQPAFKEFAIVNFFSHLINIAKEYGYLKFMNTRVIDLKVSEELKAALLNFQADTLHQLFMNSKAEDFENGHLYDSIVKFQKTKKNNTVLMPPQLLNIVLRH